MKAPVDEGDGVWCVVGEGFSRECRFSTQVGVPRPAVGFRAK